MAQLVRFEQDPDTVDGAGVFHFDSGEKRYAYDPEMAAQASKLESALAAAPDNRLAANGKYAGMTQAQMSDAMAATMQADTAAQLNPQGVIDNANNLVGQALAQAAPQQAGGPPSSIAAQPPGDMAEQARQVMGNRAAEDILRGTKRVYQPGSPGMNPAKMLQNGVMVPTGESIVTEGGAPYNREQAQERIGAAKEVRDANLAGMELQRQQTENELSKQRLMAPMYAQAAADAEAKHAQVLSNYRMDRSRLQEELDDYEKKAHVNPDRFFDDRGTFATIGMAIAQGLGAYASTMTGAPNFAYEMVQKAIDRDIAAQRDQIEAGRVGRRNKMAAMMDNYGFDAQQAEAAMRIAMNKSAQMQAELFANESKLPQYQIEAQKYDALARQEIIKNEQALYNASIGKHTKTVNQAFLQPKAATSGGFVEKPLSSEEMASRAKLLPRGQGGDDIQELEPKERLKLVTDYGAKRAEFSALRATYDDLAKAYGYRIDWKTKQIVDKNGKPVNPDESGFGGKNDNIPGVGPGGVIGATQDLASHGLGAKQAGKRVQEARAKVRAAMGKALSGASVSPQQDEMIQMYATGDDDASALRGLTRSLAEMDQIERDTVGQYHEETRAEWERRQRVINRETKTSPKPVKVTEY